MAPGVCRGWGLHAPRAGEGRPARVLGALAELLLDPQELVVLRDPVAPRRGTRLDLPYAGRDGQVGDGRILGLAGAVGHDRRVPVRTREVDRLERLRERPDLVHLDEDRVADALVDAAAQALDVRDEQVVADELHAVAELLRQAPPRAPVVLCEPVLDGHDRVARAELLPQRGHAVSVQLAALEPVAAVGEDLRRGRVERDPDAVGVTRPPGRLEDDRDRLLARTEIGREAALVAHRGREAALVQELLQPVERLHADSQRLGEGGGAGRHDHELLQVERVLRVRAAVDDVQHRHRQHACLVATQPAVERDARLERRRLRRGERAPEHRVRPEPGLVRRSVELDEEPVEARLVVRRDAHERGPDLALHVLDGAEDALAEVGAGVAVAELHRLELPGGGTGGHVGAADGAGVERHLDLHGRVAARVENLAGVDAGHLHRRASLARSK